MKRLLIVVSLALAGVAATVGYYWQQATQLPAWYTTSQSDSTIQPQQPSAESPTVVANADQDRSGQTVPDSRSSVQSGTTKPPSTKAPQPAPLEAQKQPTKQQLRQNELTRLFTTEITRKAESKKLGSALKGANTTMQNGTVESGAVVNLSGISPDQLPPDERAFFSKLMTAFPELGRQSFYVGVEGKPKVKNGQAQLDEDLRVKLGNLSFTPAQLSERLGIPEDQIRQQLQLQVQLGNLKSKQLADDRPAALNGSY
ncbi:MAG: hypothetical protein KME45_07270 [Stenomitos rutilans HA7619-LM2]|jgi:hypothetical protein|nr:hypothetical protein [Stenomitos rutilans HA7619-LM2]